MAKKLALCPQCDAKTKVLEAQSRATMVPCDQCGQMLHNPWRQEAARAGKPLPREPRWMRILFWVFPTRVKIIFGITLAEVLLAAGAGLALSAFVIHRTNLMN